MPAACLAQSVERKALNLVVVGSSPTVGVFVLRVKGTEQDDQTRDESVRITSGRAELLHFGESPNLINGFCVHLLRALPPDRCLPAWARFPQVSFILLAKRIKIMLKLFGRFDGLAGLRSW